MSELRRDPVIGRWVIIAPERALRPDEIDAPKHARQPGPCVFCSGQESRDPTEIYAVRAYGTAPNTPGWQVRVLPNKYPVLRIEGRLVREGVGMFDMMTGVGAHEVIVETPDHDVELADLPEPHICQVLYTYRERMNDLGGDNRFKYVLIFKNQGHQAGATLSHTHSQLIATPVTPKRVKEELVGTQRYYEFKRRCVFCDIIKQETRLTPERLVLQNDHFVVISPFAARVPYETWIIPKLHNCDFVSLTEAQCGGLAHALKQTLLKLRTAFDDPPLNYLIHTAPFRRPRAGYWATIQHDFHWHVEVIPRLTRPAGFEEGSGFYINPVPPEDAAAELRAVTLT
ncbi:MAG: galactose-1-phosphate uridylyltransferase [Chloroflexi bacterium HGW-Chloroflexi-1]|nr:MAG: galactose-1-phosphate uridylyltransferase [Chloroflexi bacterium HGW-Chloroflexi-1]